jgi:hypothetical protein
MFLLTFLFFACNEELNNIHSDDTNDSTVNKIIQGDITESEFPYIIQTNSTTSDNNVHLKSVGIWEGPFYVKGNLNKIYSQIRLQILPGKISGIVPGIYFCDVYSYSVKVNLPTNCVSKVDIPNPCGYSNFSTQTIGVNYTQTSSSGGTTLTISTFTIVISYNAKGQYIGKVCPVDGNNITFSYSYMTY